jgi:hypothetical protein
VTRDDFDDLLLTAEDDLVEAPLDQTMARPWLLAAASLAVVGALVIVSSVVIPSMLAPETPQERVAPLAATPATPTPTRITPRPAVAAAPAARARISALPDQSWLASTAHATGIPDRALAAYAGTAIELGRTHPDCALGWNTLAGIGSLDGDAVWDRAVGPMPFIPSTWAEWGTDGSGDGVADPQNIDDAALSAARYLCGAGADLSVSQNWLDAIWSYNGTTEYVSRVSEMATSYATTT